MNLQKAEMKMSVAREIGKKFEGQEEAALADVHRFEGAIAGFNQAIERLESVKVVYNAERDEGKLETPFLECAIKAIDRCRGVLVSLSDTAQAQKLVKQGEWINSKKTMDFLENLHNDEKQKLTGALEAIERGEIDPVSIGRPQSAAAIDLQARKAEAREKQASKGARKPKKAPTKKD